MSETVSQVTFHTLSFAKVETVSPVTFHAWPFARVGERPLECLIRKTKGFVVSVIVIVLKSWVKENSCFIEVILGQTIALVKNKNHNLRGDISGLLVWFLNTRVLTSYQRIFTDK